MHHRTRTGLSAPGWVCTLALLAGSVHAVAQPDPQAGVRRSTIRWSNGLVDRLTPMPDDQVRLSIDQLAARPDARHVLLTLDGPADSAARAALERAGVTLLSPLGGTTYFAAILPGADSAAAVAVGVSSVGAIDPSRKMHADIAAGLVRSWTVIGPPPAKLGALLDSGMVTLDELRQAQADPVVACVVMFHRDADLAGESARLARAFDAQVRSRIVSVNAVVIHARASQLRAMAGDDAVMWVEPPLPALDDLNAENRALTGVNTVNAPPYGLDGTGVTVMVYDGGQVFAHGDLSGRLTIGPSDTAGISNHATHVAGTIGGSGAGNPNHRGMAPGVEVVSYGLEQAGGLQQGFLYTDPCDIETDYTEAISVLNADIANNSIGTNTEPNGYPCEWQGNYGVTCALIDAIARGSTGDPFRIIWAAGNERQGSRCNVEGYGQFYSTAPPAGAKNHIAVGSVDSNTDLTSSFSSWGPVDDGRLKPDISAPGCQVGGDNGVTSLSSSGGYTTMCGTSMASPTVAGISALILEQWRLSFPGADDPRNCTLKALLANTAQDRGNTGPDYQYGYGSVRADKAVDAVIGENVIEAGVGQGDTYRFVVVIGPDDTELRVTVAWDDAPGTPNVNPVLVNDLDIRVLTPGGQLHQPWTLNPTSPTAPAVRTVRDGLNNIEQVVIDNPAPGGYTVEVTGVNIADGGEQPFGAVSNGFLVNCTSAGIIALNAPVLSCSGAVGVQVIDCDLNTSDSVVDTVQAQVSSTSDPIGLTLLLTETAPDSAKFLGSFTYSSAGGTDLAVAEGDEVTAVYTDADDGAGGVDVAVTRTVGVDCTPPAVVSAFASEVEPRSATLAIQTDEPTALTVLYGTSPGSLDGSADSTALRTNHSIEISGLQDNTTYIFVISAATDAAGNTSSDDNGGAGYAFTTPEVPDFFTEQFVSGIDLDGKRVVFSPNGSFDFYQACVEPLDGALPVDPAGGVNISLSDDDNQIVSLTGGEQVAIYGDDFSEFYIGSNGYVTFGAGDTTYSESLEEHFDTRRISALFDDLNPSDAGTVSWKQLDDRAAVTWLNVTEYGGNNSNTVQIEMFFDGRIAVSHLAVDSNDAIVGLSGGGGVDPEMFPSDLSAYAECGNCPADLAPPEGVLNFFDISAFLGFYNTQDPAADLAPPFGDFNFFDITAYLDLFNAGCP